MPGFQVTILIIAVILLIIALTLVGMTLKSSQSNTSWPPTVATCPDYWALDPSFLDASYCRNPLNLGTCKIPDSIDMSKFSTDCDRYNWATGCNLSWDGITYGVQNPCDASSSTT
jgi:hypothetical protein